MRECKVFAIDVSMGTNLDPTELTQGPRCLAPDAVGKLLLRWLPWKRVRLAFKPNNNSCPQTNVSRHSSSLSHRKTTDIKRGDYETPVVSFVNQGDGRISVDLCGRVMTNENELYAMAALTTPAHLCASNLATMISSRHVNCQNHCYVPQPPLPPLPSLQYRNDSFFDCDNQPPAWYFENMTREQCVNMLAGSAIGSFAVRTSSRGCYALSVSVPVQVQPSGVAHYLIIRTSHGSFKIKVCTSYHGVKNVGKPKVTRCPIYKRT